MGWYRAGDGSLAYRAWRYVESNSAPTTAVPCDRSRMVGPTNSFAAESPFFGVRLNLVAAKTAAPVTARLRRELSGTGWSTVIREQTVTLGTNSATTLWCEPQTAGNYQLELIFADSSAMIHPRSGGPPVEPILLTRREPSQTPQPFAASRGRTLFRPTAADAAFRQNARGFEATEYANNASTLHLTKPGAAIDVSLARPLRTNPRQWLALVLRNGTSAGLARVFWAGASEAFEPARSAWIPLVQNDDAVREYHLAIGLEPAWHGTVTRLRIEPATGMTERGTVGLGDLRVLETPSTKNYCQP